MTMNKSHRLDSSLGNVYSWLSMLLVAAVCLFIIITVAIYGYKVLSINFLISEPNSSAINTDAGGILTPLIGTVLLTVIGILIAYPFSLSTAIYLNLLLKKRCSKKHNKNSYRYPLRCTYSCYCFICPFHFH